MGKVVGAVGRPSTALGTFIEEGNLSAAPTPVAIVPVREVSGIPTLVSRHGLSRLSDCAAFLPLAADRVDNSTRLVAFNC